MTHTANKRRDALAQIAERLARKPLRGDRNKAGPDLAPILAHFTRKDPKVGFDWCAAFVYHCCAEAGFVFPARYPDPVRYSFAAVPAWLQWAKLPGHRFYYSVRNRAFVPHRGDLVIFDRLLGNDLHDHIAVVVSVRREHLITAEGNISNASGVFRRSRSHFVRGFVRIPDNYQCAHRLPPGQLVLR